MIKAAVIGCPIKHSKSPLIHGYWLNKYNISGSYDAIEVTEDGFREQIDKIFDQGYSGFNVTVPHKIRIMDICDLIDDNAKAIGAVNTVVKLSDGRVEGGNTDAFGFIENIKKNAPKFKFDNNIAMILGAGGASRACIYGLLKSGIKKIYLTNRTLSKSKDLAEEFKNYGEIKVIEWDIKEDYLKEISLLVNTTALGMSGSASLDISLGNLPKTALVNDIVYAPLYTKLLKDAKDNGNEIVTGIGMLLHQARPAFNAWFNQYPNVTKELEDKILL